MILLPPDIGGNLLKAEPMMVVWAELKVYGQLYIQRHTVTDITLISDNHIEIKWFAHNF